MQLKEAPRCDKEIWIEFQKKDKEQKINKKKKSDHSHNFAKMGRIPGLNQHKINIILLV